MGGGKSGGAGTTYDYYGTIACGICAGPIADLVGIIMDGSAVWPQGNAWPTGGASFNVTAGQLYVYDAQTWVAQQNMTVPANPSNTDNTIPGNNSAYWVEYTYAPGATGAPGEIDETTTYSDFTITDSSDTTYGDLRIYWGIAGQVVDPVLDGNNDSDDVHPSYAGVSYCIAGPGTSPNGNSGGFLLGQQVQAAPNIEIIVRRVPQQTVVTNNYNVITDGQCNLAAFMAELLTSENGIGLPAAALDAVSFNNVASYMATNEQLYGASPLIDTSDTLRSVCEQFTQMIDGFIRFNPATGLIELGIYQHGATPAEAWPIGGQSFSVTSGQLYNYNGLTWIAQQNFTVPANPAGNDPTIPGNNPAYWLNSACRPQYTTLTEDSLTEAPQLKSTSWQGTYSRATVRYNDRQLNFQQTSLHADDPRAWAVLKSVREISLDRPWITRAEQALLHGRETLRVMGHAQITGTLSVRREIGRNIRAGDYVLLDVDIEPNVSTVYQYFRVTKRTIPMTGPIKLEILADNSLSAIVASNIGAPVISQAPPAPAVTNFRFAEIPTILSGERGAVAPLVQRPSNLITNCQLWFDTNPSGTFQLLGSFSGFAAKGTLAASITVTATQFNVNVDTTQPDANFFTQQMSSNEQADDTLLAFIVQNLSDPGNADNGQIAESNGYALMEICSVGAITLVSAGVYQLNVLRGRQNTVAAAFSAANSEVWLIPRANVASFTASLFPTLRANRAAGLTPAYAQFRLCAATFVSSYPLSGATSEPFHFALNSLSAPTLTLTAPATYSLTFANQAYPIQIPISGTWTDPNGQLVQLRVLLQKSTDTSPRTVLDQNISPVASQAFSTVIQIEQAGTYTLSLVARDSINFTTTINIPVTVTGGASTGTCAVPSLLDENGNQLLFGSGGDNVGMVAPFGPLNFTCSTPGATIYFSSTGPILVQGGNILQTPQKDISYIPGIQQPYNMPYEKNAEVQPYFKVTYYATAPGLNQSATIIAPILQVF